MDLMSLMIRIGADITGAQKGIQEVQTGMDKAAKSGKGFGSKLKTAFSTVAKAGAGLAAGVVAAGAAVTKLATGAAATTDRIDKMSQKIGISRKSFQEMDFIMSQSGGSVESLQMGMKTLRTTMVAAANGTKTSAEKFKQLGVSVKDSSGKLRNQEDVMFDTLAALQKVGDETKRSALATELFGRAGVELVPLLNSGAGSIEKMKQQAHDLGLVLNDDAIDAGVHLTDTIDQVKRSFDAVVTKIGVEVMPVVQTVLDAVLDNMPIIQTVLGAFFKVLSTIVSAAVKLIGKIVTPLKSVVSYAVETFGPILANVFENCKSAAKSLSDRVNNVVAWIKEALGNVGAWLDENVVKPVKAFWDEKIKPIFDGIGKWLDEKIMSPIQKFWDEKIVPFLDTIGPALEPVKKDFTAVLSVIKGIFNGWNTTGDLFEVLKSLETSLVNFVDTILPGFSEAWGNLKTFFGETIAPAIDTIKTAFTSFWDDVIKPFAQFVGHAFVQMWNNIPTFWNETLMPALTTIRDAFSAFWTEIITPLATFIGDTFIKAWTSLKDYWEKELSPRLTKLHEAFDVFKKNVLAPIATFLNETFTAAWNGIMSLFSGEDGVESKTNSLRDTFKDIWDNVLKPVAEFLSGAFSLAWSNAKDVMNGLLDFVTNVFKGDWKTAWTAITTAFGNIFGRIVDKVKTPINKVIDFLNGLIAKVESTVNTIINGINGALSISIPSFGQWIDMPDWLGGSKYIGFPGYNWSPGIDTVSWGRIKKLAEGGIVRNGQHAIVGEAGYPEYLRVLNGQAIVTPMKSASAAGGDSITFNIYQQPNQDPRQLADIVQRQLVQWERERRAVYR